MIHKLTNGLVRICVAFNLREVSYHIVDRMILIEYSVVILFTGDEGGGNRF